MVSSITRTCKLIQMNPRKETKDVSITNTLRCGFIQDSTGSMWLGLQTITFAPSPPKTCSYRPCSFTSKIVLSIDFAPTQNWLKNQNYFNMEFVGLKCNFWFNLALSEIRWCLFHPRFNHTVGFKWKGVAMPTAVEITMNAFTPSLHFFPCRGFNL